MKNHNLKLFLIVAASAFALGNLFAVRGPEVSLVPAAHAQTANQKSNFISKYRNAVDSLTAALEVERTLRRQYDALDLGNALADADFTGENVGITKLQFTTAVAAADTVQTAYGSSVRTSLYKVAH